MRTPGLRQPAARCFRIIRILSPSIMPVADRRAPSPRWRRRARASDVIFVAHELTPFDPASPCTRHGRRIDQSGRRPYGPEHRAYPDRLARGHDRSYRGKNTSVSTFFSGTTCREGTHIGIGGLTLMKTIKGPAIFLAQFAGDTVAFQFASTQSANGRLASATRASRYRPGMDASSI